MKKQPELPVRVDDTSIYNVPAVDRAARILWMLATETREMTLAEVTAATGWHKSSVHKILVTLTRHGFLDRNRATKKYSLGMALVRCGQAALNNLNINHSVKSLLKELADDSGETANMAVLRGNKIVIVEAMEAPVDLRVSPPIGTIDSVTAKSNGKAVLAWLPEDQVARFLESEGLPAKTKRSITKVKDFLKELGAVREQGFATDFEEFQQGISAVSAPVFDSHGQVMGTISIVAPAFRMTREKAQKYGRKCSEAAARLSSMMR